MTEKSAFEIRAEGCQTMPLWQCVTPDEALNMICPAAIQSGRLSAAARCCGPRCMAWAWIDPASPDAADLKDAYRAENLAPDRGYCEAFGRKPDVGGFQL